MSRTSLTATRLPSAARRILIWVGVSLALLPALYIGVYIYGTRSDAFESSRQWLLQSAEIQSRVGVVKDVRLSFWGGYSEEFSGDFRSARLTAKVFGEKGESEVDVYLRKNVDEWAVVDCEFN